MHRRLLLDYRSHIIFLEMVGFFLWKFCFRCPYHQARLLAGFVIVCRKFADSDSRTVMSSSRRLGGVADPREAYISSLAEHVMSRFNFDTGKRRKRSCPRAKTEKKRRRLPSESGGAFSAPSIVRSTSLAENESSPAVSHSEILVLSPDPVNSSAYNCSHCSTDSQSAVSTQLRVCTIEQSAVNAISRDCTIDQSEQSVWARLMPIELLILVFAEVCEIDGGAIPALCRLARVCRLWRNASQSSELWRSVDLSRVPVSSRSSRRLAWLVKHRLSHVQHLSLEGWSKSVCDSGVQQLCVVCGDLRSLNVSGCSRLTGESLACLARDCPRLTSLTLASVHARTCRVTFIADVVRFCRQTCGRLEELCLSGNSVTTLRPLLHVLVECCSSLRVLDLSNISQRCGAALSVDIAGLQRGCPHLQVLRWANTSVTVSERSAPPPLGLPTDSQCGFPELQEFSTAMLQENSSCVSDSALWRVLYGSSCLRLLDVRGCHRLTPAALLQLPAVSERQLQQLYISSCSGLLRHEQLAKLMQLLAPVITHLELSGFLHETHLLDASLEALTPDDFERPPLQWLNVANSAITPESLTRILSRCRELRMLDLTSCRLLERGVKRRYDGDVDVLRRRLGVSLTSSHDLV